MPYTFKQAKQILRIAGLSLSKKDDEYRVNYLGGAEATAYYTDDITDAVGTGLSMRDERMAPRHP